MVARRINLKGLFERLELTLRRLRRNLPLAQCSTSTSVLGQKRASKPSQGWSQRHKNVGFSVLAAPLRLCVFAFLIHHLFVPAIVRSQEPVVAVWEMDPPPEGGWTVGDLIPLRLRVTYSADMEVTLPELPDQWGAFEVREQILLDPVQDDSGAVTAVREVKVTLWAPDEYETPPLAIHYRYAGGELRPVPVPPLSITVASVLAEDDLEKRDLKPQASLPRPPAWPWLVAGVVIAGLLFFAGRWLWQRLRRSQGEAVEPVMPVDDRLPEEIAYGELDRIATLDLPVQDEFKRHYTLVADCVRVYLEGIYRIPAMDRTTGEVIARLHGSRVDGGIVPLLRTLLEDADLVKFARFRPTLDQARQVVVQARHLVDISKPDRASEDDETEESITQYGIHNT